VGRRVRVAGGLRGGAGGPGRVLLLGLWPVWRPDRQFYRLPTIAARLPAATRSNPCLSPIRPSSHGLLLRSRGPPGGPCDRRRLRLSFHRSQALKTQHLVVFRCPQPPYLGLTHETRAGRAWPPVDRRGIAGGRAVDKTVESVHPARLGVADVVRSDGPHVLVRAFYCTAHRKWRLRPAAEQCLRSTPAERRSGGAVERRSAGAPSPPPGRKRPRPAASALARSAIAPARPQTPSPGAPSPPPGRKRPTGFAHLSATRSGACRRCRRYSCPRSRG
jgi:hypothetical protein